MAAITSQTFHHTSPLSGGVHLTAQVLASGVRLLQRLLAAQPKAVAVRARGRVAEAEAVRRLADGWLETDPSFAADLYAAAARHDAQELR